MEPQITVEFRNGEGEIRRILGVIEQRGFEIVSIALPQDEGREDARMTIGLRPRGAGRSVETLGLQLTRLQNVRAVQAPQSEARPG